MLFEAWSGPDGWREGREAFANELNPSQMCIQVKDVYKKNSFVLDSNNSCNSWAALLQCSIVCV